jgi:nucleoid DNA-binding protein
MTKCSFSNELVTSISEKTKIKPKLVIVILEIFVFLMKRILIDEKVFYVHKFGSFRVTVPKNSKWKKVLHTSFRSVDYMKSVLKGSMEPALKHSCDRKIYKQFEKIATVLGLKVDEIKYLFNLFFYNISLQLLQNSIYKINRFGYIKVVNNPLILMSKLSSYLKKKNNSEINCKTLKFKVISSFHKEINGKCTEIKVSPRVRRLLYLANIDISTRLI